MAMMSTKDGQAKRSIHATRLVRKPKRVMWNKRNPRMGNTPPEPLQSVATAWFGKALLAVAIGLVIVGLVLLGAIVWQRIVNHARLSLRHIVVQGNQRCTSDKLVALADVAIGTPLLNLDLDAMAVRMRTCPWAAQVIVRRKLPDSLYVHVVEHEPALFVSLKKLYVANADGQIFKQFAAADHLHLPVLTGLAGNDDTDNLQHPIRAAMSIVESVENHTADLGVLEELHWDEHLGFSVVISSSRVSPYPSPHALRVHLGQKPLERMALTIDTLRLLEERHLVPSVIWADSDKNPNRSQVELLVSAKQKDTHGTKS